jgi:hypothetical protein
MVQNKNIPIFFHVPKNAGTFAISLIFQYLRVLRRQLHAEANFQTIRNIVVKKGRLDAARILALDPTNECSNCDKYRRGMEADKTHYIIDLDDMGGLNFKLLNIFTVVIEAAGFTSRSEILEIFKDYDCRRFIVLRDPIKRMFSLFNYLNSDSAKHEATYGIIPDNISDYINGNHLGDSWLIRQFVNLPDECNIEDSHYDLTYDELKDFQIADIKDVENLVIQIYKKHFNLELSPKDREEFSKYIVKNESKKQNHELTDEEKELINHNMRYGIKLYEELMKL